MPLLIVRHAPAVSRSSSLADFDRPLSETGEERAAALVRLVQRSGFRPRRILSSPARRCMATVALLAEERGLPIEAVDALGPEHPHAAWNLVQRLVLDGVVLVTHQSVLDVLVERLVPEGTMAERGALRLRKGEAWVVEAIDGYPVIVDHLEGGETSTLSPT